MEFGVLGPLQVGGRDVALPGKQRVVLAALLLRVNRVVALEELIDAVWDEAPPGSARVTVQGYVKRLRRYLGTEASGRIITRDPGYLIEAAAGELDVERFTGLCRQACAAAVADDWHGAAGRSAEALGLWRGDPLADVPSAALRRAEVPRLTELRLQAVERSAEAGLRRGRHEEMVAELRRLADGEPLREGFHRQLMVALYRCGRQAEALAVFRDIDRRLRDEFGISAGPALRQLHERILTTDPSLAGDGPVLRIDVPRPAEPVPGPAPAQLPPDTADFTGREVEVKVLRDLLAAQPDLDRPGAVAIGAVAGMGGIGKTALAVHVAHGLRERFPDGQLYVDLHGATSPRSTSEVLARFLRDLGDLDAAIPADGEERAARYRSLVADRRILIVLDDAGNAAQVRPLLPGSAGCAVIVTSRNALTDLAGAAQLCLGALGVDEARDLFTTIVGSPRAAADPEATARVLASCAGLPLAVRIAGSRLVSRPGWNVGHLATRPAGERDRPHVLRSTYAAGH